MQAKPKIKEQVEQIYIEPQELGDEFDGLEISEELQFIMNLHDILAEFDEDAPMVSQLEGWKKKYGQIYVSKVVDNKKFYVWRTLNRSEYKVISASKAFEDENIAQEIIIEKCMLYPQLTQAMKLKMDAGVITTLGKQISYQSGFISNQEALSLIKVV